jgi:hypothetical protein
MAHALVKSHTIKKALDQGYIWVKNDIGQVFKSRINGIIYEEKGSPSFILTCEDRTTTPPSLQCYQYKQYVYSSCWALTKEELKPYKEEISFGDYY